MGKIKIILWVVFLLGFGMAAYSWGPEAYAFIARTRCSETKKYSINSVDARFNLTPEEFKRYVDEAAKKWNTVAGMELFEYDPQGELDFNLVFDERQGLSSEIKNLEGDLDSKKDTLVPEIAEYERLVEIYKRKADDLNNEIIYYNSQGGAPEEKFSEIIEKQRQIEAEARSLNELASKLNQSTDQYNVEVGQLNSTVKNFNTTLEYKPEQGIYAEGDERVEIYFTTDEEELVHTIMHEMGHSLGLDHLSSQNDIMFSYTSTSTTPSPADLSALGTVCSQNVIAERYKRNFQYLKQMFLNKESSVPAA